MHNTIAKSITFSIKRTLRRFRFRRAIGRVKEYAKIAVSLDEFIDYYVHYLQEKTRIYFVGFFVTDPLKEYDIFRNGAGDVFRSRAGDDRAARILIERKHQLELRKNIRIWDFKSGLRHETQELPISSTPKQPLDIETMDLRFVSPVLPYTSSEATIPLYVTGSFVGLLLLDTDNTQPSFEQRDLPILLTLANQLAIAVNQYLLAEND